MANENKIVIETNEQSSYVLAEGQEIQFNFDVNDATFVVDGNTLIIEFSNGTETKVENVDAASVFLLDGDVEIPVDVFLDSYITDVETAAGPGAGGGAQGGGGSSYNDDFGALAGGLGTIDGTNGIDGVTFGFTTEADGFIPAPETVVSPIEPVEPEGYDHTFLITEENASYESQFGYYYEGQENNSYIIFDGSDEVGALETVHFTGDPVHFFYHVNNTGRTYTTQDGDPGHIIHNNSIYYLEDLNDGSRDMDYNDMTVDNITIDGDLQIINYHYDGSWGCGWKAHNVGDPSTTGTDEYVSIKGYHHNFDQYHGDAGLETYLVLTEGKDALFLDNPYDQYFGPNFENIDVIYGANGNDVIDLTSDNFFYGDIDLYGGSGNDIVWSNSGNDNLYGGSGNDNLYGGDGNDNLYGSSGNDLLNGAEGNDELYGGIGTDELYGGIGNDILNGGAGNDIIMGGTGDDIMIGGTGNDTFIFDMSINNGNDQILDFGSGDKLVFTNVNDDVDWGIFFQDREVNLNVDGIDSTIDLNLHEVNSLFGIIPMGENDLGNHGTLQISTDGTTDFTEFTSDTVVNGSFGQDTVEITFDQLMTQMNPVT